MKKSLSVSDNPNAGGLSTGGRFRAIVEWDPELPADLVIYPLGDTAEESERISEFLRERLTSQG